MGRDASRGGAWKSEKVAGVTTVKSIQRRDVVDVGISAGPTF
jgi:hypothetical protein